MAGPAADAEGLGGTGGRAVRALGVARHAADPGAGGAREVVHGARERLRARLGVGSVTVPRAHVERPEDGSE